MRNDDNNGLEDEVVDSAFTNLCSSIMRGEYDKAWDLLVNTSSGMRWTRSSWLSTRRTWLYNTRRVMLATSQQINKLAALDGKRRGSYSATMDIVAGISLGERWRAGGVVRGEFMRWSCESCGGKTWSWDDRKKFCTNPGERKVPSCAVNNYDVLSLGNWEKRQREWNPFETRIYPHQSILQYVMLLLIDLYDSLI